MDAGEVEKLGEVVMASGGRDKEGKPLLTFATPPELPAFDKTLLTNAANYALTFYSDETRRSGLSIVVDAQKSNWRLTRMYVRHLTQCLANENISMLVVRPEVFWDKRVDHCTKVYKHGEPLYLPLSRLNKYIEHSQVPDCLGGSLKYDHQNWLQDRIKAEKFFRENTEVQTELERVCKILVGAKEGHNNAARTMTQTSATYNNTCHLANILIQEGRILLDSFGVNKITDIIGQDVLDTRAKIEKQVTQAKSKLMSLHHAWISLQKSLTDAKEVMRLEGGVRSVTDWLLATGEALLASHQQVGYDIASAEQLRREHETLELHCRETYGHYAELLHKIFVCSQKGVSIPEDLLSQRDFMNFVCRSFATRLERRRNILITSARFYRLVAEYFKTTSEVYENLVMPSDYDILDNAHSTLLQLKENQINIDTLEEELFREGEKLTDLLAMPVKDALGREICIDYVADIVNVQEILEMTRARSELFKDSVELQRINLQQAAHIHTYEEDAAQAIKWLEELFEVMLNHHSYVGCNVFEIQRQKEDHQAFQETAKGIYEYGYQLLSAALSLRQMSKLSEGVNTTLCMNLSRNWQKFQSVSHHQMTRLRVTAVFHRTLNEQCKELKELIKSTPHVKGDDLKKLLRSRERLLVEVARMIRLARLLKSHLKEPLCNQLTLEGMDYSRSTVDAISERVAEVTSLAEQLDAALGSTQEICIITELLNTSPTHDMWYGSFEKGECGGVRVEESSRSEEDFTTASECTCTPPSRSSSYYTASEGDAWWLDVEKTTPTSSASQQKITETDESVPADPKEEEDELAKKDLPNSDLPAPPKEPLSEGLIETQIQAAKQVGCVLASSSKYYCQGVAKHALTSVF